MVKQGMLCFHVEPFTAYTAGKTIICLIHYCPIITRVGFVLLFGSYVLFFWQVVLAGESKNSLPPGEAMKKGKDRIEEVLSMHFVARHLTAAPH